MKLSACFFVSAAAGLGSAQLVLPYSGTDPTATLSSFQILKSGSSGRANTLYITNPANSSDVLLINTVGLGRASYMSNTNPASGSEVLQVLNNGKGIAVFGYMTGTGKAGIFRIVNSASRDWAVWAKTSGQGAALRAEARAPAYAADLVGSVKIYSDHTGYALAVNANIAQSAIYGFSSNTGVTGAGDQIGVLGANENGSGFGVFSNGNSGASGTKAFHIDHPLDPENKYLNHYSSEAPEPMNFYSGNIVTDARGYAVVRLPDYFGAINRDFRYQLSVLKEFAQAIVAEEIENNQFTIRTDRPRVKVSWRVEAVRNDPWVQHRGYQDVQQKPVSERGKYLHPELYGQPAEQGLFRIPTASSLPPRKLP